MTYACIVQRFSFPHLHTVHVLLQKVHKFTEGVGGLGECLDGEPELVHLALGGLAVPGSASLPNPRLPLLPTTPY